LGPQLYPSHVLFSFDDHESSPLDQTDGTLVPWPPFTALIGVEAGQWVIQAPRTSARHVLSLRVIRYGPEEAVMMGFGQPDHV
jgi:hypothetical protein